MRKDFLFALFVLALFVPFFLSPGLLGLYERFNSEHGLIMSFVKFAILATMGESIGLRIKTGVCNSKGFGIVPRAIVWGFLGITIKLAFTVFTTGTIQFLAFMGFPDPSVVYSGDLSAGKVFIALCISIFMNTIFAPVMMTFHKITDTHILNTGGTVRGLFSRMDISEILKNLNWDVQWNFVFKKTIPFFWYPAHTITFLLPGEYQVLFAALLGIALGLILAVASLKSSPAKKAESVA